MFKTSSGFTKLATLSQDVSSACSTCGNLRETSKTLSISLKEISVSAEQGCKSCMVMFNSYARTGRSHGISSEVLADVAFQIPVLDKGYPMGIASSDDDGWYSWNEVYTKSSAAKAPWPLIGQALERKSTAFEAIPVLKGWIETCLTSHPECASQTRPLPTRVLDVSGGSVSLYISQNDTEPYIALSHCWGESHVIQTHRSTIQSRILDIEWQSLSQTFQDAITTTRELGIRYLWIDSLCIVQDDPRDWATESGNMASIYEGARVVIAASETTDGHDGFLKPRSSTAPPETVFKGSNSQSESYEIRVREGDDHRWYGNLLPPRSHFSPDSSRLSTRGWAFQERLLATRYVQFRLQELVWECRSCLWCECGVLSRPSQQRTIASQQAFYKSLLSSHNDTMFSLWSRIVNTYCRKVLTNGSDMLPALSGLAKRFQIAGAGNYLAGLWQKDLPLCLLWEAHATRAVPYRAPSWSWASMDTSLEGSTLLAESTSDSKASAPTDVLVTIDAVSCTSDAADPTGRVSAGSLTLTGKTVQMVPLRRGEDYEYESPYDWAARRLRFAQHVDSNGIITGWATRQLYSGGDAMSNVTNSRPGFGAFFYDDLKDEVPFEDTEHTVTVTGPIVAATPNYHHPRVSRKLRTLVGVGQAATTGLNTESIQGNIIRLGDMTRPPREQSKQTISNSPPEASLCDIIPSRSISDALSKPMSPGLGRWADLEQEVLKHQTSRHKVIATPHVLQVNQKENLRRQSNMSTDPYTSTFGFHADTIISDLDKSELTCILIGETYGAPRALVLRRLDSKDTDKCLFERVGLIDRIILGSSIRSNEWKSLFHDAPTTTITIV